MQLARTRGAIAISTRSTFLPSYMLFSPPNLSPSPSIFCVSALVFTWLQRDIESAIESYDLMSQRLFTHASPTLFNAGTPRPQLSSCFLLSVKEDSIEGIYDTLKQVRRVGFKQKITHGAILLGGSVLLALEICWYVRA